MQSGHPGPSNIDTSQLSWYLPTHIHIPIKSQTHTHIFLQYYPN